MISVVLASALVVAPPAPASDAPARPPAPAASAPTIDSILQSLSAPGETTDGEEDSDQTPDGARPGRGPIPYSQLDSRVDVKLYDQAVRETAAAARARGGPLEGGWTLTDGDGQALYRFQLTDHGPGPVEGAWRDLNGGPRLQGSGFIAGVGYDSGRLMLRFYESGPDDPVLVTVTPGAGGAWNGSLWRNGSSTPVVFRRN